MVATRAAFLEGHEVVEVQFDPRRLSFADLLRTAVNKECAQHIYTTTDAQQTAAAAAVGALAKPSPGGLRADGEPKYGLFHSPLRALPLTQAQAVRVNARLRRGGDVDAVLSPQQRAWAAELRAAPDADWPNLVDRDLREAWEIASGVMAKRRHAQDTDDSQRGDR